ncbi:MAG: hypothetical protein WEF50_17715 [Myxococcota bacterium]
MSLAMLARALGRLAVLVALLGLALPAQAGPTRYDPRRAGHPLRIAAYIAHPFGVILDTLIFHPAWWIGQHEPFHTLFGVQTQLDDNVEVRVVQAEPDADIEDPAIEPDED